MTGEVISMQAYIDRKEAPQTPPREELTHRLAEIALAQLTLQSEKQRIEKLLFGPEQEA